MNEFLSQIEERLKNEKGLSIEVDTKQLNEQFVLSAMYLKKQEDILMWNGKVDIPQDFLNQYPMIQKVMQNYSCEMNIFLQPMIPLYWVNLSFLPSLRVLVAKESTLLKTLDKLEDMVFQMYQNSLKNLEEKVRTFHSVAFLKKQADYFSDRFPFSSSQTQGLKIMMPVLFWDTPTLKNVLNQSIFLLCEYQEENQIFLTHLYPEDIYQEESDTLLNSVMLLEKKISKKKEDDISC